MKLDYVTFLCTRLSLFRQFSVLHCFQYCLILFLVILSPEIIELTLSWRRSLLYIEISPLICRANQWTGFYYIAFVLMLFMLNVQNEDLFLNIASQINFWKCFNEKIDIRRCYWMVPLFSTRRNGRFFENIKMSSLNISILQNVHCNKKLSQILANNIDNGVRGVGLRSYVRHCGLTWIQPHTSVANLILKFF